MLPDEQTKTDDAKGNPVAPEVDADRAGISSIPVSLMSSPDLSAANISTVDQPPSDDGKGKAAAEAGKKTGGAEGSEKGGDDNERYDKLPRFKEIIGERDKEREARIRAEAKVEALTSAPAPPVEAKATPPAPNLPFKDITLMSPEEIREWMEEDPVGYEANRFAQFHHESKQLLEQEAIKKATADGLDKTFSDYEKNNPDFKKMWDSGELLAYMKANPGHNAISAHKILTEEVRVRATVDAAVKKAIKETEERVTKNFQAKRNATVLTDGPGVAPGSGPDTVLQNTKQFGGFTRVMADKLNQMRHSPQ